MFGINVAKELSKEEFVENEFILEELGCIVATLSIFVKISLNEESCIEVEIGGNFFNTEFVLLFFIKN